MKVSDEKSLDPEKSNINYQLELKLFYRLNLNNGIATWKKLPGYLQK